MNAGKLIKEGRRRAGLTQQELARRLGTRQPAIARWENGRRAPDFETVVRVLNACGLELGVSLTPADESDDLAIEKALSLTPRERLAANRKFLLTERWAQTAKRVS